MVPEDEFVLTLPWKKEGLGIQAISDFCVVKEVFYPNFLQKAQADLKAWGGGGGEVRIGKYLVFLKKHEKESSMWLVGWRIGGIFQGTLIFLGPEKLTQFSK